MGREVILAVNCGSSSLKYAMFDDEVEVEVARGAIERVGSSEVPDHNTAVGAMFAELALGGISVPSAIGHRLVHGGPAHLEPQLVDDALLAALEQNVPFAPLHLPAELRAIEAVRARYGDLPQVVCFDTAFHRTLPEVARRFALPAGLYDAGVRRYGFHGLSYEHIAAMLEPRQLNRAVFAHLGSGASMVAVREGRAIETTMGLTPTGGLVMGTRPGDLDPGLVVYLLDHGHDARSLERLFNHESGLLALSGRTADVQELLARRAVDPRAALAVDSFCYHARKTIGAFAAVLGGLDTLVFTGGIGEHSAEIRSAICADLAFLGVSLEEQRNRGGDSAIHAPGNCEVLVIPANEERVVARWTRSFVKLAS